MPTAVVFFQNQKSFDNAFLDSAAAGKIAGMELKYHRDKRPKATQHLSAGHFAAFIQVDKTAGYHAAYKKDAIRMMFVVDTDYQSAYGILDQQGLDELLQHITCWIIKPHPRAPETKTAKNGKKAAA